MSLERRSKRGHDFYMDVWHRPAFLRRYVGKLRADWMSQVDVDSCEYCSLCREPVALIETKDVSAISKSGEVTARLAGRAHLDFYLVEYELAVLQRRESTPEAYAEWLWLLRYPHWQRECDNPRAAWMLTYRDQQEERSD